MSDDTHIYAPIAYTYLERQIDKRLVQNLIESVEQYICWIQSNSDCLSFKSKQKNNLEKTIKLIKEQL